MAMLAVILLGALGLAIGLRILLTRGPGSPNREPEVPDVDTAVGRFKKGLGTWYAFAPNDWFQFSVWDRDGVPDPAFIQVIPDVLSELPEFEARARAFEPELTRRGFEVGGLFQRTEGGEWALLFEKFLSRDPLVWTIDFESGQPVRSVEGGS